FLAFHWYLLSVFEFARSQFGNFSIFIQPSLCDPPSHFASFNIAEFDEWKPFYFLDFNHIQTVYINIIRFRALRSIHVADFRHVELTGVQQSDDTFIFLICNFKWIRHPNLHPLFWRPMYLNLHRTNMFVKYQHAIKRQIVQYTIHPILFYEPDFYFRPFFREHFVEQPDLHHWNNSFPIKHNHHKSDREFWHYFLNYLVE
ncbi:MAG: hypothetical protein Q9224_005133, partial [Gallowayella concinna]